MKVWSKSFQDHLIITRTPGLKKTTQEDISGVKITKDNQIVCLCDGHWGDQAAIFVKNSILKNPFPKSKTEAVRQVKLIEKKLWQKFGNQKMDPEKDFTPETSLLAVEKNGLSLNIMSYGDCRLLVIRNKKVIFRLKTNPTWLGAFSFLGLRNRLTVNQALVFKKISCKVGDIVMVFSDGVDECQYEKPTLSYKWLAEQTGKEISLSQTSSVIFAAIKQAGAEDNATLAFLKMI